MTIETRWSKYKPLPPRILPFKEPEPWWKALWVNTYSTVFVLVVMVVTGVLMPAIKLGIFHWQVWDLWKKGNKGGAIGVFVFGCAVIDAGLIWAAIMVARGDLKLW
jgi:hypothetical protein